MDNIGLTTPATAGGTRAPLKRFSSFLSVPHQYYTLIAGFFGLVFVVITPPSGAGDEPRHFERMYEVATGHWLGAPGVPAGIAEFTDRSKDQVEAESKFTRDVRDELNSINLQPAKVEPYARPLEIVLRVHNPLAYLPYAPTMWLGMALDLPPARIFFLCKLTTLIVALFLMRQAIRMLPTYNHLAAFVAMFPTSIYYLGAANIDALLMGASFLFFAMVARHAATPSVRVRAREVALLAVVACAVSVMKTPYAMLPMLAILIPASKFSGFRQRACSLGVIILPGLIIAVAWALMVKLFMVHGFSYGTPDGKYVQPSEQLAHVLGNPLEFAAVLIRTIFNIDTLGLAVAQAIGLLGWNNVPLPAWAYALSFTVLIILWSSEAPGPGIFRTRFGRLFQIGLFLTIVLAAFFFLYLQWTGVGAAIIAGFQGRYLLPIAPLLFALAPVRLSILGRPAARGLAVCATAFTTSIASVVATVGHFYV